MQNGHPVTSKNDATINLGWREDRSPFPAGIDAVPASQRAACRESVAGLMLMCKCGASVSMWVRACVHVMCVRACSCACVCVSIGRAVRSCMLKPMLPDSSTLILGDRGNFKCR